MVKIFAAGDLHGDSKGASDLADKANENDADLIILNGDITEEHIESPILSHFYKLGKKMLMIPGNHDYTVTDFLSALYKVDNIHKNAVMHKDIGIVGCSSLNLGLHQMSDDEIYSVIVENFKKIKGAKKKVLVTHVHPSGTNMEQFSNFVAGSKGLRKAIEKCQPDIVICGHVHEAEGLEDQIGKSKVINVGKRGKFIDL